MSVPPLPEMIYEQDSGANAGPSLRALILDIAADS